MPAVPEKSTKKTTARIEETYTLHPKSRKYNAVAKKFKKDTKKEQRKQETKLKQSLVAEKLLWFQKNMNTGICPYTNELTAELVKKYIARHDEEIEQINIKRSIGSHRSKQHFGREQAINMTKEREINDYEGCGLEIPNIVDARQCAMLQKWNGDLKLLPNFKFCHFSKRHLDDKLRKKQTSNHKKNIDKQPQNGNAQKVITKNCSDSSEVVDSEISTNATESQLTENEMDVE